jgi:hypothetical protein
MTKDQLQKELKEKVREGVKPSDIKKLKRSKSDSDIPAPLNKGAGTSFPKAPPPLTRSQSNQPFNDPKYPYTTLISQQADLVSAQQELDKLRKESESKSTTISLLRKKVVELENSLSSLDKERQELETNPDLDNSLLTRHKNLKD